MPKNSQKDTNIFSETTHYADVFAAACNNSALDVDSLANSMSVAAPMFSAAGYKVDDAALALGLMGNAGIDAEVAANSLKTGISRLVSTTEEGETALRNLGFGSDDTAECEKNSLTHRIISEKRLPL